MFCHNFIKNTLNFFTHNQNIFHNLKKKKLLNNNNIFYKQKLKNLRRKKFFYKKKKLHTIKKTNYFLILKFIFTNNNIFINIYNEQYKLIHLFSLGKIGYKKSMKKSKNAFYSINELLKKLSRLNFFKTIIILNGYNIYRAKLLYFLEKHYKIIYLIDNTKISFQ